jgi:hypothetical protein
MKTHRLRTSTVVRLALLALPLVVATGRTALANPVTYSFSVVATLEDSAPLGGHLINDFETGAINNHGDLIFGADLGTTSTPASFFGEGVFLRPAGQTKLSELAHATGSAPGGGIFDFLLMGQTVLNEEGDGAFGFALQPFDAGAAPLGLNAGVYRYSHITGQVTPVVIPNVTPAPGGGAFAGAGFNTSLNNRGDLVFTGIVGSNPAYGVFKADKDGRITSVVSPGDAAPGGGSFDSAGNAAWIDQGGDIALVAHLTGEESGLESLYLKKASSGTIVSLVHAADPEPCGGKFRSVYSPVLNDSGEIVFQGDLSSPPNFFQQQGLYLYAGGKTLAVACPGDPMPGGGKFLTTAFFPQELHINNPGEVVFGANLDNGDTGLYLWSHGSLRLVTRAGTVLPGVGTVSQLTMFVITFPPPLFSQANAGAINNDRGQVLFGATLTDMRGVLLLATPRP